MDRCVLPMVKCCLHKKAAWVAAFFITTVFLTALFTAPAAALEPRHGGILTFGVENEFAGFDALKSGARLAINGAIANNTIQEPLFRMDKNGGLIPVLGLAAEATDGGKSWTIKLRRGVAFHDGTPFDAGAVIAHYQRLLNPENRFRGRGYILPVQAIEKIDEFTVRFLLAHPWLPFLSSISNTRGLGATIPSPKAVAAGTQDRAPVGTGPFKFSEWQSGDRFVVVKNTSYWQKDRPYLDQIVFRPLPDQQTRFASLMSGETDLIWIDRGHLIEKARADDRYRVIQDEDNGAEIFLLNTSKPPLDDVSVRRALAHAHNQSLQVKMVYQDSIPVVHHPFGAQFSCEDNGYREFDPQKAKQALAEYGKPVEIECLHSNSARGRDIGVLTQKLLKDVGVTATPVGLDFSPVIKKVLSADFQIATWRMSSRPDQGPALFNMFHSQSKANYSHYSRPEMDRLLLAQRLENDPVKRNELLCQIIRMINDDVPILYRGGMRYHVIARRSVQGISELNAGILQLTDAWIDK